MGAGGVGLRTLRISRVATLIERFPVLESRFFTQDEIDYCRSRKRRPAQHYAVRLAAKLAVRSILGAVKLRDIEIARTEMGAPQCVLRGRAAECARGTVFRVSLSHDEDMAVALVVAGTI